MAEIRVGTRASTLARTQTGWFTDRLRERSPGLEVREVLISTEGDRSRTPLSQMSTTGVFVSALREELLAGGVDVIVHSMKDLPAAAHLGIVTACVPEREDPRDVLLSRGGESLRELPESARVGTCSPRRAASLRRERPDLEILPIRGNVDSRIDKVHAGDFDATVLALAGLRRLGRAEEASELLDPSRFVPAAGQGALAVECRSDDLATIELLAALEHTPSRITSTAERAVLLGLKAGCSTAIGASASWDGRELRLSAELAVEATGEAVERHAIVPMSEPDVRAAQKLGLDLAAELLASPLSAKADWS